MKNAATVISEQRKALLKRMDDVMQHYDHLNDAEFILSQNVAQVRKVIAKYKDELSKPLLKFFTGDGKQYSQIDKIVWDAQRDFEDALKSFDIVPKVAKTDRLMTAIRSEYTNRVMGQIDNTFRDLVTKSVQFQTMAQAAVLPVQAFDNKSTILRQMTIAGKNYDGNQVKGLWDMMTERYGRTDTVRYTKNGAGYNFPMRSYIDMRTQTTAAEVARMVSAVEASVNEIYTGKISRHGAKDSCQFWEGKIVFYSASAKGLFLQQNPQYSEAAAWPTLQELEADKTHMFRPHCKHRILPYPIDMMGEKRARNAIEQNTMPDIPEKINERELAA